MNSSDFNDNYDENFDEPLSQDADLFDDSDYSPDDDEGLFYCPACGEKVNHFTEICPNCSSNITPVEHNPKKTLLPIFYLVIAILIALIIISAIV